MANYLYNGIELPDINEVWTDKETLPYAYIEDYRTDPPFAPTNSFALRLTAFKWVSRIIKDLINPCITNESGGKEHLFFLKDGKWVFEKESNCTAPDYYSLFNNVGLWSNHDILRDDGSIHLAASDPVPVGGEPTPQDFYIVKNGVGQKQDTYLRVGGQWVKQDEYRT